MVDIWEGDKGPKIRGRSRAGLGGPNCLFHVKSFLALLYTIGNIAVWGGVMPSGPLNPPLLKIQTDTKSLIVFHKILMITYLQYLANFLIKSVQLLSGVPSS